MRSTLCKIWNFALMMFQDSVEAVAIGLKTLGEVLVPVLGAIGQVVGDTIGSVFGGSNLLVWAGMGIFAYFVITKKKDDTPPMQTVNAGTPNPPELQAPAGIML